MTDRNVIQTTFDEFGKKSGSVKRSGSWYRRGPETIFVLNLQKSQYSIRYYVNIGLWLLELGDVQAPKANHCHVQTRLASIVPESLERHVDELFDLAAPADDIERRSEILDLLNTELLPLMDGAGTLEGLRDGPARSLVDKSLVTAEAGPLLRGDPPA